MSYQTQYRHITFRVSLWHLKDEAWNLGRKLQNLDCHMYNGDI